MVPCFTSIDEARRSAITSSAITSSGSTSPRPSHDDLAKLRELFGFHPLALEDTEHFGQRPKLDNYGDYVFLVFYGAWRHRAEDPEPLREVHLFISGKYLITVHRDPLPPLDQQRHQLDGRVLHSEQFLLYRVLDALTDSFFPLLADMDDEIDELEAAVLANPTDAAAPAAVLAQAPARRDAQGRHPAARPVRPRGRPDRRAARASSSTSATTSATSTTT